ncbi:MAG: CBS domain-containing protein [Candidatus Methylomirabilaceae bacterium]
MTARDIMTSPVYTIRPTDRVKRAIALLCTHRISGVPVVDGKGHLVGLISERDILEAMYPRHRELQRGRGRASSSATGRETKFERLLAKDIMMQQVITAPPEADVLRLASIMALRKIRRIPIVQGQKLLGIVSQGDVYRAIFQGGSPDEQEPEAPRQARRPSHGTRR